MKKEEAKIGMRVSSTDNGETGTIKDIDSGGLGAVVAFDNGEETWIELEMLDTRVIKPARAPLYEYTDDELRSELKRRSTLKRKQEKQSRERYRYYEAVVTRVFTSKRSFNTKMWMCEVDREIECRYPEFPLLSGAFNKDTRPKVGDVVRLKGYNYVNKDDNWSTKFRVDKVIKRKED